MLCAYCRCYSGPVQSPRRQQRPLRRRREFQLASELYPHSTGRQRSSSSSFYSSSSISFYGTILNAIICTFLATPTAHAQTPTVYTARHSAGSTIANNILYIVSGTTSVEPSVVGTAETLAVPLDSPFTTDSIPWTRLQAGYFVQDARVTTAVDQKHLILAGVGDQVGQLVVVYDIEANSWSYLPATAAANAQPQTPRTLVGLVLDPNTGQAVLYGGLLTTGGANGAVGGGSKTFSLSLEFDFLDTRPSSLDKWAWSATVRSTGQLQQPTGLVQPILLYLPTKRVTLIMGGCSRVNPADGNVTQCVAFSTGYLVSSMVMTDPNGNAAAPSIPISTVELTGPMIPPARLSPCATVLSNGDVFMYGGAAASGSLGDAWVLRIKDWTWVRRSIANMPFPGRAGGTCQQLTEDQLIVVGGFDGGLTGPRQFSNPQVAVINTTSWAWTSNFIPARPKDDASVLSPGIIIGIVGGCCIILGIMFAVLGRMLWRRHHDKKRHYHHAAEEQPNNVFKSVRASRSNEPLMDTEDRFYSGSDSGSTPIVHFVTKDKSRKYDSRDDVENNSDLDVRPNLQHKSSKEPFLVIPYPPRDVSSRDLNSTGSLTTMAMKSSSYQSTHPQSDTLVAHSVPLWTTDLSSDRDKRGRRVLGKSLPMEASSRSSELLIGERLPQTEADIQHSHYVRTLQHHKQYEMRRMQEQQQNPYLNRSGTQHTIMGEFDRENPFDQGADESFDLTTSVIELREVDVGEEPMSISYEGMDGVEDGTILLSSHLDTSKLDTSQL
ncbi:hypothetical protein BGZ72_008691 [Mortierella alpina]|nr:hypothetical protein BGZ72_008691 [Mortierella alpina]